MRPGKDWEVLVVDNGSQSDPPGIPGSKTVFDHREMPVFNKPALQNVGIDAATGDVLTFLDADTVVGPRFLESAQRLRDDPSLTKLCYRVRVLIAQELARWEKAPVSMASRWFDHYRSYPMGFEAYGEADRRVGQHEIGDGVLFGNSHFSIHRDVLGNWRFDEAFEGRGFEDIAANWSLWHRDKEAYRAELVADGEHACFTVQHPYDCGRWHIKECHKRNQELYKQCVRGERKYAGERCLSC
jgi:glycosyltransferase involved in cell wall biosynthesis